MKWSKDVFVAQHRALNYSFQGHNHGHACKGNTKSLSTHLSLSLPIRVTTQSLFLLCPNLYTTKTKSNFLLLLCLLSLSLSLSLSLLLGIDNVPVGSPLLCLIIIFLVFFDPRRDRFDVPLCYCIVLICGYL